MGLVLLFASLSAVAVVAVLLAFLVKQTIRVARAVQDLSSAVTPALQEIQAEAERARSRSQSIAGRQVGSGTRPRRSR